MSEGNKKKEVEKIKEKMRGEVTREGKVKKIELYLRVGKCNTPGVQYTPNGSPAP